MNHSSDRACQVLTLSLPNDVVREVVEVAQEEPLDVTELSMRAFWLYKLDVTIAASTRPAR